MNIPSIFKGRKMEEAKHILYKDFQEYPLDKMISNSKDFMETVSRRRSIRNFSSKQVPIEIINNCLIAAGSAPSGANMQPWHFAVVSDDKTKKIFAMLLKKKYGNFILHVHRKNGWMH